jgi:hypothetical protein
MSLYDTFNTVEGLLWWGVAVFLLARRQTNEPRRQRAVRLAAATFLVFGVTDWLELGSGGRLPLWLWGLKIACGGVIFFCRYEWRGWHTLRWSDREVLFAIACLVGVAIIVAVQHAGPG